MIKFKNLLVLNKISSIKNVNKLIFILISIVILIAITTMSRDAGISGDEYFHVDHATDVYDYYKTFGKDKTALHSPKTLHLYGQSLDNQSHIINEFFNIDDIYTSRHLLNSIVGWILILFSGLTAALLFGWRAGYIAMFLLFFSPRILGHSFNNLKDIPFAAACAFSIYFIIRYAKELPKQNFKTLLFIILGIAWAISLRIGGIILIPYLFFMYGLHYITQNQFLSSQKLKEAFKHLRNLAMVSVLAYFLGLILWPYALQNPLSNPFDSLKEMTNYGININQLFEGSYQKSGDLPWYYGIKYILITSPIIVFIGCLFFIVSLLRRKAGKTDYVIFFFLSFAFLFPLAYTIYQDSTLYGGWRHLLWIYSPLVILSAGGLDYYINNKSRFIKYAVILVVALFLIPPVKYTVKNHPHQYTYFNQLVGGIEGAYGKYEVDYYYHGLKEAADWLIQNDLVKDTITITTNHSRILSYYLRDYPNVKVTYSMYYRKNGKNWDYAVWTNTHIHPHQLNMGYWPPKENIYTVYAEDVPIAAVVKRISYSDLKGFKALNQRKTREARENFDEYLSLAPESEEVWEGYALSYWMEDKYDSAHYYIDRTLSYNPGHLSAFAQKARFYNSQKKYTEAVEVANKAIQKNEAIAEAHFHKGIALKNLDRPDEAIRAFQLAINAKKEYDKAYIQIGEILTNYKSYSKALDIYSRLLKFKKNDLYATIYSAKCHHFLKNDKLARELLNPIPKRYKDNLEAIKVKFRIALRQNDLYNAEQFLNMAQYITNDGELWVLRAMYVLRYQKRELAKGYLDKAIGLDPVNKEAKEMLKIFQTKSITSQVAKTTQQKPNQQQSIMFQKPKPKQTSPITVPRKY